MCLRCVNRQKRRLLFFRKTKKNSRLLYNVEILEHRAQLFTLFIGERIKRKAQRTCIKAGKTVCCYTTRALITADTGDKEDELRLSVKISDAVQSLVGRLSVTPSFVIAKGGITSSDVGTKALAVKKANVLGQIKPGIPVWQTGEESKFPLTPYVIFPGNVGEITTLREAVEVLTAK